MERAHRLGRGYALDLVNVKENQQSLESVRIDPVLAGVPGRLGLPALLLVVMEG